MESEESLYGEENSWSKITIITKITKSYIIRFRLNTLLIQNTSQTGMSTWTISLGQLQIQQKSDRQPQATS
jgi:hypothetical protein